jgi:Tetratricopeptide repeat
MTARSRTWRHLVLMREFVTQVTALSECLTGSAELSDRRAEEELYYLLNTAGSHLIDMSDVSRSVPLLEQALADRERLFRARDLCTVISRNSLANAYQQAGRLDEAIRLHRQPLADLSRIWGWQPPAQVDRAEQPRPGLPRGRPPRHIDRHVPADSREHGTSARTQSS